MKTVRVASDSLEKVGKPLNTSQSMRKQLNNLVEKSIEVPSKTLEKMSSKLLKLNSVRKLTQNSMEASPVQKRSSSKKMLMSYKLGST